MRFLEDGYEGYFVVSFRCWRHLTDAVFCVAAGLTVSQGFDCLHHGSSGLMSCFFFFPVGFCHSYSLAALWQRHEILCNHAMRGLGGWGKNPNVVKHSHTTVRRKPSCEWRWWPWAELWKKWPCRAPRALRWIWSPVSMRDVVVLLSGNKRSHHSQQNIKNNAATGPVPQQLGGMNHPEMYAFNSFGLLLAFWHLLEQCRWKDRNTVRHEKTKLFIIVDY